MKSKDELLNVRQVAAETGRTPETVRRWVWSGRLQFVRQGHRLLIERTDLDKFLANERGETRMTLREWIDSLPPDKPGRKGRSAADLVLEDRRKRSGM